MRCLLPATTQPVGDHLAGTVVVFSWARWTPSALHCIPSPLVSIWPATRGHRGAAGMRSAHGPARIRANPPSRRKLSLRGGGFLRIRACWMRVRYRTRTTYPIHSFTTKVGTMDRHTNRTTTVTCSSTLSRIRMAMPRRFPYGYIRWRQSATVNAAQRWKARAGFASRYTGVRSAYHPQSRHHRHVVYHRHPSACVRRRRRRLLVRAEPPRQ